MNTIGKSGWGRNLSLVVDSDEEQPIRNSKKVYQSGKNIISRVLNYKLRHF